MITADTFFIVGLSTAYEVGVVEAVLIAGGDVDPQFEMNYSYTEASVAADQVQLYKLLSRQVAARLGMTASFLPKPVTGINGSGMHTNLSVTRIGVWRMLKESM